MPIKTITNGIHRLFHQVRYKYNTGQIRHSIQAHKPYQLNKNTLNLLSFNIHVGISIQQYRHFLTRSWQHILPNSNRLDTLNKIAKTLPEFDLVALQEVDGGSIRSNFINQTEYLAHQCNFPYWYNQINRNLGKLAQHSNGLLSRFEPVTLEDHKLPGLIPGRGAIVTRFGKQNEPLMIVMMHLALSKKARSVQLAYIRDLVQHNQHVVLMGDMNTNADELLNDSPLKDTRLYAVQNAAHTFPSWRPGRALDHILVSDSITVNHFSVINMPITDHLPVSLEIQVPNSVLTNV